MQLDLVEAVARENVGAVMDAERRRWNRRVAILCVVVVAGLVALLFSPPTHASEDQKFGQLPPGPSVDEVMAYVVDFTARR